MNRSVTVSVVSHGHGNDILQLLEDMALLAANDVAKVIITLNVPEELLTDAIRSKVWPFNVEVILNKAPLGFGGNHNQAFALCQTPFFCVVNPDIRFRRNPYPDLLGVLQSPGVGCAYPMQSTGCGEPCDLAREIPTPMALMRRHIMPGYRQKAQPREWINGSFMLFSSHVYARLKGFDQRFFMYCEDVDICLRLRKQGFSLILSAGACVEHRGCHASRRQLRHLSWHLASLVRLWFLMRCGAYRSTRDVKAVF